MKQTKYRAGMVLLFAANCAYLTCGVIMPVIEGVVPITQFAPLVLSALIALVLASGEGTDERFRGRRHVYLTLSAVLVAFGAVSAFFGSAGAWISSVSGLLLLGLVTIVIDKKKNVSHRTRN
ncbi:hypothetical protein ACH82I_07550 [Brevibacterium sp. GP-SGM9]|uniref:hypothetical protein n=1 Tax=Brevibacterium sp. GP-SGM9 TaxID=3376990 RepID=UPI0039A69B6D